MKQVKLSPEQYERWRLNRLALLAEDGTVVRYATPLESRKCAEAMKGGKKIGLKRGDGSILTPTPDRTLLRKELTDLHGACIVKFKGGRRQQIFRLPAKPGAPVISVTVDSVSPNPETCQCSSWHGRVPGRHHRVCKFNQSAPTEERGDVPIPAGPTTIDADEEKGVEDEERLPDTEPPPQPEVEELELVAVTSPTVPITPVKSDMESLLKPTPENPPEPGVCVCMTWQKPAGYAENHHPVCEFFEPWNRLRGANLKLKTLEGRVLRPATVAECEEAKKNLEETGAPTVDISGVSHVVME